MKKKRGGNSRKFFKVKKIQVKEAQLLCLVLAVRIFSGMVSVFLKQNRSYNIVTGGTETSYKFILYNKKNLCIYFHKYIVSGQNILSSYYEHRVKWSWLVHWPQHKNKKYQSSTSVRFFSLWASSFHFILFLTVFFFSFTFCCQRNKKIIKKVTKTNKISTEWTLIFTTIK